MKGKLKKKKKENFDSESVEFAIMFLLISQGCYYPNELEVEDKNVLRCLDRYGIKYTVGSGVNKKYCIKVEWFNKSIFDTD